MTIVMKKLGHIPEELVSGVILFDKKRVFYKRDREGFYFIPETVC